MFNHERIYAVRRLLFDFVKSPSLKHIKDTNSVNRLAEQIIASIDREPSVWTKWQGRREGLLEAASCCWIPIEDMRSFLNEMPGPPLTQTDVAQRLRAFHEEPYASYPNEELREGCLTIYEQEKAEGTELPAIVGALQEFIELETARRATARDEAWRQQRKEEQSALEQRFLAGADTKWTAIQGRNHIFTRKNGRTYRLARSADKRWELFRIQDVSDTGALMGTYGTRGDATKALQKLAYEPEPRW